MIASLAVVLTCAGCFSDDQQPSEKQPVAQRQTRATVAVQRQDLTSVLVLSGTTIARPEIVLRAGSKGALTTSTNAGAAVRSGQQIGRIGSRPITAPVAGTVTDWSAADQSEVSADNGVANLAYAGFGVSVAIPPEEAYRLYSIPAKATTQITGGPAGVACELFATPTPAIDQGDDQDGAPAFACLLPPDTEVMAGLPARLGIQTAEAKNVLVVPTQAVLGDADRGVVSVIRADTVAEATVELGITDGNMIEIRDGLAEGDEILAYAPVLGG